MPAELDFSGAWACMRCHVRFEENYDPDTCAECGALLMRPGHSDWPFGGPRPAVTESIREALRHLPMMSQVRIEAEAALVVLEAELTAKKKRSR